MMVHARPPVPQEEPVTKEGGTKSEGRPKRCKQKRKRLEKDERGVVSGLGNDLRARNLLPAQRISKRVCTAASASANATATAPVLKAGSKKRPRHKQHKSRSATTQTVVHRSGETKGQGAEVGRQSSQYRGVYRNKSSNKWLARIGYDGKQHYLGCFEDEEEAARAYDKAVRTHQGEKALLNFPTKKQQAAEEAKQQRWIKCEEAPSKYRGVSWQKSKNKWRAEIRYDGKDHYLGSFEDEEEAARAYDKAARAHRGEKAQLNFPAEGESGSRRSSKHPGAGWAKINNKWVARIYYDGQRHHLGSFDDEEEAAGAYDTGGRRGRAMKGAEKQARKEEQARKKAEAQKVREEAEEVRLLLWLSTPPGAQPSRRTRGKRAVVRPKRYEAGSKRATAAAAPKTGSKKRRVQKRKKAGAGKAQSRLTRSKKGRGQGEGAGMQSSQYRGVCWEKRKNKWKASIHYDGKQHSLGYFEDEEGAARAYDKAMRVHKGEKVQLNFPTKKEQAAEEAKQQRWIKCGEAPSKYRGVCWDKRNNKWKVAIWYDGNKRHHLGCFEDEEQAARAYDGAARAQHRKKAQLNFPAEGESGAMLGEGEE
jgi:hypothetical protein